MLDANGVRFEELTETERTQVLDALAQMSGSQERPPLDRRETPSPVGSPLFLFSF